MVGCLYVGRCLLVCGALPARFSQSGKCSLSRVCTRADGCGLWPDRSHRGAGVRWQGGCGCFGAGRGCLCGLSWQALCEGAVSCSDCKP